MGQRARRDMDIVEDRNMETSVTEIERRTINDFVNLQSGFSKYFPEAVNIFTMNPFCTDSPQNYEFLLKKKKMRVY